MIPHGLKNKLKDVLDSDLPDDAVIDIMTDFHVGESEARFISGVISGGILGDNVIRTESGQAIPAGNIQTLDAWLKEQNNAI